MARPHFKFEDLYDGPVCGIDEVGRGPLAGPVVAASVIIRRDVMPKKILREINDSKQLMPEKRAYLAAKIHEFAVVSIAESSVEEIDSLNILQASLLAMKRSFEGLKEQAAVALIDGNKAPLLPCHTQTIIDGDAKSLSIAAASIVAKHHRDQLMQKLAIDFPHYGWHTNAGYSTAFHLKAIEIHGITPLHRRSFAPVSERLLKESSANS